MIQGIQGLTTQVLQAKDIIKSDGRNDQTFSQIFNETKALLQKTNEAEEVATELTNAFITGENEDIHNLMIAQEKSSILLQFTMQVRNNVIDAYKEIMRLTV
jgi:flagellar hook-basal body complex protein FliE